MLSSATSFSAERNVNTAPPSVQHSGPEYFPSPMQLQSTSIPSPSESHSGGVWAASANSSSHAEPEHEPSHPVRSMVKSSARKR